MIQLPFPSTVEPQLRNNTILTITTVVRKIQKNDGQTGSCAWTRGGGGARWTGCQGWYIYLGREVGFVGGGTCKTPTTASAVDGTLMAREWGWYISCHMHTEYLK